VNINKIFVCMVTLSIGTLAYSYQGNASRRPASAMLNCVAEDGSTVQGTINDKDEVSQIKFRSRMGDKGNGKFISFPEARVVGLDFKAGSKTLVASFVLINKSQILAAVSKGVFVDGTGVYELTECTADM